MATPTRTAPVASNAATSATATFAETPALDGTYALVALAHRAATGSNPAPDAPGTGQTDGGWTLVASAHNESAGAGVYTGSNTWDGIYVRQGNGTVNSFKMGSSVSANNRLQLYAVPNCKTSTPWLSSPPSATGNAASGTIAGQASSLTNACVFGILGVTGTFGGSGASDSTGFTRTVGGSSSSLAWMGYKSLSAPATQDLALAWTTSQRYAGVTVVIDTEPPSAPISASGAITGGTVEVTLTADANGPITSVDVAIVTAPAGYTAGNVSVTGGVATCDEVPGRTEAIVIDFTVHNSSSTDVVRMTLPAPGGAPVTLLRAVRTTSGWVEV